VLIRVATAAPHERWPLVSLLNAYSGDVNRAFRRM
jgi:hypothetical protein